MKYSEELKDLFTLGEDFYLTHCISADFGMGAGIVVLFNKKYDLKNKMLRFHEKGKWSGTGYMEPEGKVLNLITKEFVWHKPTYAILTEALKDMKKYCLEHSILKIGMPLIGCGIDGLTWSKVRPIVKDIFYETDIEIHVCYIEKDGHLVHNC